MASAPSMSPSSPQQPRIPPRPPLHRPAPRRAHTLLFWTVFLLFIAALGYLGLLAFTGNTEHLMPSVVVDSHRLAECLVALCAVAVVAGGVVSRHHLH